MKIMIFLSSTYNYYCKLWRVIMKELPDTFYLYFCFFFFLTWVMKLDRSLSVKVSNISWFPGGDNDNFSLPFQHGYTLLKFKICFYYDLFSILFYFAIFSTISLSLSLFFFFFRLYYMLLSPNENAGSSHTSNNACLGVLFRSSNVRMTKVQ